ncbi:hypothetical protein D9M71_480080 [compost metagenome]
MPWPGWSVPRATPGAHARSFLPVPRPGVAAKRCSRRNVRSAPAGWCGGTGAAFRPAGAKRSSRPAAGDGRSRSFGSDLHPGAPAQSASAAGSSGRNPWPVRRPPVHSAPVRCRCAHASRVLRSATRRWRTPPAADRPGRRASGTRRAALHGAGSAFARPHGISAPANRPPPRSTG